MLTHIGFLLIFFSPLVQIASPDTLGKFISGFFLGTGITMLILSAI